MTPFDPAIYRAPHVNEERQAALFGEICSVEHLDGKPRLAVAIVDGEPTCQDCAASLQSQGFKVKALL